MKSKVGSLFMILGTLLVILALCLFVYNQKEAEEAAEAADTALQQVFSAIEERNDDAPAPEESTPNAEFPGSPDTSLPFENTVETPELDPHAMTVVEIDGIGYVGYLTIPDLGLQLPVLAELDNKGLEIGPCRYEGSTKSEDLVIGAHNYVRHFARIWRLKPGAEIVFTDMDGISTLYEVDLVETLSPTQGEYLLSGEYPLTLFTCTYTGNQRTAVRCILN